MRVSVIIPTLNEAHTLSAALTSLAGQLAAEIIVVDGGSSDGTAALARQHPGTQVIESERGRARQMNRGAARATGDVLLFLHADCQLAPGALAVLRTRLQHSPRIVGGCFRQRYRSNHLFFRCLELALQFRAGVQQVPYGDQGIFARRTVFEAIGGFPDVPLMEDVRFSQRLRCVGPLAVLNCPIYVSPRRCEQGGLIKTWATWQLLALLHAGGVSPERLARWYADVR